MLLNSCSIPNSLLEALIFTKEFSPVESKLLLFICRKTIGWHKETDWITKGQMSKALGWKCDSSLITPYIKSLIEKKAIVEERKGTPGQEQIFYSLSDIRWGMNFEIPPTTMKVTPQEFTGGTPQEFTGAQKTLLQKTEDKDTTNVVAVTPTNVGVPAIQINQLIKLFEKINPTYQQFYTNKTQRSALERVLKSIGEAKLRWILEYLPQATSEDYAPRISTPLQLESKLGDLIIFLKQKRSKENNGTKVHFISK